MFEDPDEDLVGPVAAVVPLVSNTSPVTVSGESSVSSGVSVGQADWRAPPELGGAFSIEGSLSVDARLDTRFRAHATIGAETSGQGFTAPVLEEAFVDYTLGDTIVFRAGRQSLSWGQGRLFNPADLVEDVDESLSIKMFAPVFGNGLTLIGWANAANVANATRPTWREFVYAAQYSGNLGPLGWGLAARVRRGAEAIWAEREASGFLRSVVAGADVYTELLWNSGEWEPLFGLYKELSDPRVRASLEATSRQVGAAVKVSVGSVHPGLRWVQYLADHSGEAVVGVEWEVDNLTKVTWGVPLVYGGTTSAAYREATDDRGGQQRWAIGVNVTLSARF